MSLRLILFEYLEIHLYDYILNRVFCNIELCEQAIRTAGKRVCSITTMNGLFCFHLCYGKIGFEKFSYIYSSSLGCFC